MITSTLNSCTVNMKLGAAEETLQLQQKNSTPAATYVKPELNSKLQSNPALTDRAGFILIKLTDKTTTTMEVD